MKKLKFKEVLPKKARLKLILNEQGVILVANSVGLQFLAKWATLLRTQHEAKAGNHFHLKLDYPKAIKTGNIKFNLAWLVRKTRVDRKHFDFILFASEKL